MAYNSSRKDEMVKSVLESLFGNLQRNNKMEDSANFSPQETPSLSEETNTDLYAEYKAKTGKRFRRTRNQMERGLTRDESVNERMSELNN